MTLAALDRSELEDPSSVAVDEVHFIGLDAAGRSPEQVGAVREGFLADLTPRLLPAGSRPGQLTVTMDKAEVLTGTPTAEVYREAARLTAQDLTAKADWWVMEPMWHGTVHVPSAHKAAVYSIVVFLPGEVLEEVPVSATNCDLTCAFPVRKSACLKTRLRQNTGGTAFLDLTFSHWESVDEETMKQLKTAEKA
ncbi:hypothetical protein ACFXD5_22650 [Streptomyces sp. NPDC059385]|uniref:hypothetical protein n=1 Tax=Streptomyces sp. NPDC059385 TaxID=3346817 RepID=UPI0036B359C3